MMREKLAFAEREYLLAGVNMLANSLKISDSTKIEILELISFQTDQKIWQKYSRSDLSGHSDPLTCWLSINFLTRSFFGF